MTPTNSADPGLDPIVLRFDSERGVEVVAEDRHRFCTAVSEAALACRRAQDSLLWAEEFKDLLGDLNKWCTERAGIVANCYVTWEEGGLKVFLVTRGDGYRFDFDDAVTDLELWLAHTYPDHPATVLQIPESPPTEISSFLSPEKAIQAYGQRKAASTEGRK